MATIPPAPPGCSPAGRRLWRKVHRRCPLEPAERELLTCAVRAVDRLAQLDAVVAREGLLIDSPGGRRPHPAAIESRQLALLLAKLVASLRSAAAPTAAGDRDAAAALHPAALLAHLPGGHDVN